MLFRKANARPDVLSRFGLGFLILAGIWRLFVHPGGRLPGNLVDGISGFLYGLAIGLLVLGLLRGRRGAI